MDNSGWLGKFKNPTPQQMAVLSASLLAVITIISLLCYPLLLAMLPDWVAILLLTSILAIFVYFVTYYYIQQFLYRKIKLIYKSIRKHKLSTEEKVSMIDFKANVIEDVEQEVSEWADSQNKELEELKSWAEYRRRFLGDISHELRTPIFNIQGYLDTLLDGALYDSNINLIYLQKAAKNVERINTIVEDLSSISRLESGNLIIDMQHFSIKDLAQEVFDDLEMKAREQNVKFSYKSGADNNFRVIGDRESIRQVLTNLIQNSIKYGKTNGETKLSFYDMDKLILIEVSDNGIGIPKEHLAHVFERFYRVDKSRSRDQGGSGLGLSIVKHIIDAHHQTINVRSTQGAGSTFGFTLKKG